MAVRYVRKSGSDSNGGTSPSDAWLTISKALGAAGISSGDTLYIGAGVYREMVAIAMTSPVAETRVIGDTSGAFAGDPGDVIISAWLTSEVVAGSGAANLLALSGRDFLTFENIRFESYTTRALSTGVATGFATNLIFRRCVFVSSGEPILVSVEANSPANILFDQCSVFSYGAGAVEISCRNSATATYEIDVTFKNCLLIGFPVTSLVEITLLDAANTFKPGGGKIIQSTLISATTCVAVSTADFSTSNPLDVHECVLISDVGGVNANTSGQIAEDWNIIAATTARTNVTAGSNSVAGDPPARHVGAIDLGYREMIGAKPVGFFTPRRGSAFLGFIPVGSVTGEAAYDMFGRPRPAGGEDIDYAVGAYELHDTGAKEISVVDVGPASVRLTGPADHDIRVPVQAASTTITIRGRFDTTHGTTTRPQVQRLANDEIGVTATTVTMTAAADTWETLTIGPFTPTAVGIITLRLRSRPAVGGGIAYFDTVTIS